LNFANTTQTRAESGKEYIRLVERKRELLPLFPFLMNSHGVCFRTKYNFPKYTLASGNLAPVQLKQNIKSRHETHSLGSAGRKVTKSEL
jgi:hypothetical protein